uniref:Uncharacterized protein MANES_02G099500 n=1 Tax=Rhizophora mucronata TaxID=61149 RepID=A0A2P2MJ60_RHIMU
MPLLKGRRRNRLLRPPPVVEVGPSSHDGAAIAGFKRPHNGEPVRWAPRLSVTPVGSGSSRVDFCPNIDPLVALLSQMNCILTTTAKCWRCEGKRRRWARPSQV